MIPKDEIKHEFEYCPGSFNFTGLTAESATPLEFEDEMDRERIKQLRGMTRQQRRDLQEKLVASLVCAAYNLENFTESKVVGRPKAPETHDFDAKRKRSKKMLAIEVTGFYSTTDSDVLTPKKISFWNELTQEIQVGLQGQLRGTFLVVGRMDCPSIPGRQRKAWVQRAEQTILEVASTLKVGEKKRFGSPREIENIELNKLSGNGSKVVFPSFGGVALLNNDIDQFCESTLMEKNNGCLATAKECKKQTILAVVTEHPTDIDGLANKIRNMHLSGRIPNIDRLYLVNRWVGSPSAFLTRVI